MQLWDLQSASALRSACLHALQIPLLPRTLFVQSSSADAEGRLSGLQSIRLPRKDACRRHHSTRKVCHGVPPLAILVNADSSINRLVKAPHTGLGPLSRKI